MKSILIIIALLGVIQARAETLCGEVNLVPTFTAPGYSEHSFIFDSNSESFAAAGIDYKVDSILVEAAKAHQAICVEGNFESEDGTEILRVIKVIPEQYSSSILLNLFKIEPLQSMRFVGSVRYTADTIGCSVTILQENDQIQISVLTQTNKEFIFTLPTEQQTQNSCNEGANHELCLMNEMAQQLTLNSSSYPENTVNNIITATVLNDGQQDMCQVVVGPY